MSGSPAHKRARPDSEALPANTATAALQKHVASLPRAAADALILRLIATYPAGQAFLFQSVAAAVVDKAEAEKRNKEAGPIDLTHIASSPPAAGTSASAPVRAGKEAAAADPMGSENELDDEDEDEDEDNSDDEDEESSGDEEEDTNGEMIPKEWMYEIDVKRPWLRKGWPKDAGW